MKLNGIETVGVYLKTGGNAIRNQIYTYCISSCYDKTVHGKNLGLDGNGKPFAYDFDRCKSYMDSLSTSARTNVMVSLYLFNFEEIIVFVCTGISVFCIKCHYIVQEHIYIYIYLFDNIFFFLFCFIYIFYIERMRILY